MKNLARFLVGRCVFIDESLLLRLVKHALDPYEAFALARKYGFANLVDTPAEQDERCEYDCICSAEAKLEKAFCDDVKLSYCKQSPSSLRLREALESPLKLHEQLAVIAGYICKLDACIDELMSMDVDYEPQQQSLKFAKEYQATLMALATSA